MPPKSKKTGKKKPGKSAAASSKAKDATGATGGAKDVDKSTTKEEEEKDMTHAYADDLKTDIYTDVNANPKALVHATEWRKIMNGTTLDEEACARPSSTTTTFATGRLTDRLARAGDPVEINPSVGAGMKIMTVDEWISRWKPKERFPDCLSCGSTNTKEHHFSQTWCRGKKKFESETICCECHMWSWRSYADPDFLSPEEYDKLKWEKMVQENATRLKDARVEDDAAESVAAAA
jgi:hypothetical protein